MGREARRSHGTTSICCVARNRIRTRNPALSYPSNHEVPLTNPGAAVVRRAGGCHTSLPSMALLSPYEGFTAIFVTALKDGPHL